MEVLFLVIKGVNPVGGVAVVALSMKPPRNIFEPAAGVDAKLWLTLFCVAEPCARILLGCNIDTVITLHPVLENKHLFALL